jgi:hypothetical protein
MTKAPFIPFTPLCPLATPQPYCLPVLLQFRDQLITLLHNIVILLVLIVRTISLNDALQTHGQ